MKDVIYRYTSFDTPCGAIRNNEGKSIRILIKSDLNPNSVSLSIYNDMQVDNIIRFDMEFRKHIGEYSLYEVYLEPLNTGIYYYYFSLNYNDCSRNISKINYEAEIFDKGINPWQLTVYDKDVKTPDWIKGGIMYQIFPDRFAKAESDTVGEAFNEEERFVHKNWLDTPQSSIDTEDYSAKDFFKGNLAGIRSKMDYLKKLNINTVYLNPVFESAENHRYSTSDYYKIDPYLGVNSEFKELCKDFKEENISIILDGVFSHTGSDSLYFNKEGRFDEIGAYNSKESKYYPWYMFSNYPDEYASWWGFPNLPNLNKENEDYKNFICKEETGVLNYWQKLGIKGWRLDVADELPDTFIDALNHSVKSYDKDAYILGEVWEDASNKFSYGNRRRYLLGNQLDSVMNYPWKVAIIDLMKNKDCKSFAYKIEDIVNNYPTPALDTMMNLLSTHDTERVITAIGVDVFSFDYEKKKSYIMDKKVYEKAKKLEKFASFLQFTLPGVPSIYYGDEIGMQGFADPFNRCCFDFEHRDEELLKHYIELSEFRAKEKINFKTGFRLGFVSKDVFSYYRNEIFCVINLSNKAVILDEIKSGSFEFGNKKPYFTEYGTVIAPTSFTAIRVDNTYVGVSELVFKNAINKF